MSQGFLWWSSVRLRAPNPGNMDSIPGWGSKIPHAAHQTEKERKKDLFPHPHPQKAINIYVCPGDRNGNPLQYSCLEDPMDRGAWWATAYGVAESRTHLSN